MLESTPDVDYLAIGHVARDLTPHGPVLGGTVSYAGLTAAALGLRVGVLTAAAAGQDLSPLAGLTLERRESPDTTTFENIYTPGARHQVLHARARPLGPADVPARWRAPRIVHLGPIADEVDPDLVDAFPGSLIGLTPQGWMRAWDADGRVRPKPWESAARLLPAAGAVVLSIDDLGGDEGLIDEMAGQCRLLVVTEGPRGARVYWNRDQRRLPAPTVEEIDPTGCGDIFAACFFVRLYQTRDPWEAARFANALAAAGVTRRGVQGVPTAADIAAASQQVLP